LSKVQGMKGFIAIMFTLFFFLASPGAKAQCSICTRTAQQMGDGPASGLNTGIIYLAFTPLAIGGFIGYRWWKQNRE
jgi:hypothetical protein